MPTADWYPTRESDLVQWHAQFSASVSSYATTLGLAAPVVTQVSVDATNVSVVLNAVEAATNYRSEVVAYKDQLLHGALNTPTPPVPTVPSPLVPLIGTLGNIEARTRQLVAQIKANPAFTQQMGEDMGIFPVVTPLGDPSCTALALTGHQVAIRVLKGGYPAIVLWRQRGGGPWEQVAILTTATYTDQDPPLVGNNPEERSYRVQGYLNNAPAGPYSVVVTVVTIP